MTLYAVNTKEKLTTTYMVDGRYVSSELKKINHLLRDWRRNATIKIDTDTIDLMWELHADLGSRAPIHIISGYRSPETNAMLKSIGRNVAKRSMHMQGKAIDLYFPDVPTERVRNSALVREVGGVGFYPRSGASGFVHVDSGRVRHWPGIGNAQMAKIRREYQKTVGARLGGGRVQVASAEQPAAVAEEGYPTPTPRPRPIEVLMMAAAQMVVQPVSAPAPVKNFAQVAAVVEQRPAPEPKIQPKADLALAQLAIEPVAAPAPRQNFAAPVSPVRDTLGSELEPDLEADVFVAKVIEMPPPRLRAGTSSEGDFLTALRAGIAAGAEELLAWPAQLISGAESLLWSGPSNVQAAALSSAPIEAAAEPFPPITEEDAAELEVIIAALRSRAQYDAEDLEDRRAVKGDRLSTIRSRKGDLILTAPPPRYVAASTSPAVPVNKAAVKTFETLLKASETAE
jgi:uncharacterized protein YcbK (DUF882 family)